MPHFKRNAEVRNLAEQAYLIVPIYGDAQVPLAISSSNAAIEEMCDALNEAIGTETFIVECLFNQFGELNFSVYRDADRMDWVTEDGVSHG
jgi:hypothetical protein